MPFPSTYPLISVIIPTYNRASLLQKAIASVVAQTYKNWELIVVDDGSTDGTIDVVNAINDSRIRILQLLHSGNIASLRNSGTEAGSGKWIAFLDSDDEWVPDKLDIQLQLMEKQNKRWCYGGHEFIDKDSKTIIEKKVKFIPFSGWITPLVLTCEATVNIGSLVVERKLFEETGGFNNIDELILRKDYEFVLRLSVCAEALAVPDLLIRIMEHEGRTTNAFDDDHERTAFVYKHFFNSNQNSKLKKIARQRLAHHVAEIGRKKIEQGKLSSGMIQILNAFRNNDPLRHVLSAIRRGVYARRKTGTRKIKTTL